MFDLTIDPILLEAGQDRKDLPGLYASAAPRKAIRLRGQDRVVFLFTQSGTSLLAPNLQTEMLSRLAETYFTSSGSVTAGMRATVERLNDFLLNRNLRSARQGGQVVGGLAMTVLHGASLYVLLAGPAHVFLLSPGGVEHFCDPAARGLGQARVVGSRFFTSTVEDGSSLILTPAPLAEWNDAALRGWAGLPVPELRRCLVGQALEVQAGVVRCTTGKGEITWTVKPKSEPTPVRAAPASASTGAGAAPRKSEPLASKLAGIFLSGKPLAKPPAQPTGETARTEQPLASAPAAAPAVGETRRVEPRFEIESPVENPAEPRRPVAAARARERAAPAQTAVKPRQVISQARPRPQGPSPAAVAAAKAATGAFGGLHKGWNALGRTISKLAARAIPGQPVEGLNLSPSTMLFMALAVPLAVVAVAATVYFQRGRGEQYQAFLRTAQQFSEQAAAQEDQTLRREDWNQALFWLDKASEYGRSDDGTQMRRQAQDALDGMDGIQRLPYQPVAVGGLPDGTNITRMVATINDVYLLDSTSGGVFRLYRTGQGYELDTQFSCAPGKAGSVIVGKFIDIVALPPNNEYKATVMGIDLGANLVYCAPNLSGYSTTMLTPPDSNWGEIKQMVLYQNVLYVLDPKVNAVYRYYGESGPVFNSGPRFYFGNLIPTLTDVIDIAVDQEFLYLLHQDGSMTTCTDAGFTTECSDPAPYGDGRSGRMSEPLRFDDARFVRMQSTQPPDPSLYVLDQAAASIYHFSLRKLNLQRQYRAQVEQDYPLPGEAATAFAVTPNRRVMLAFGKQIFYAALP